jgi:hypothetical protein
VRTARVLRHVAANRRGASARGIGRKIQTLRLDKFVEREIDDARLDDAAVTRLAATTLETIGPDGVAAVYVKRFARDRSRLGGLAPEESRSAAPRAGRAQPGRL